MYQQIRQKINEQCPWLMELKFGCEVIVADIAKDNPGMEKDTIIGNWGMGDVQTGFYGRIPRAAIEKILGRPPELAELLYAMNKRSDETKKHFIYFALHGFFCEYREGGGGYEKAKYDLTKSLRENIESNEELARFLLEVLV